MLFGTAANGVYILDNGNWDSLNTSNSLIPDNYVFKITVDLINRYWIGIPNYGIATYYNGSWTLFHDQNSFQGIGDFNFIEVDSSNKIWVGTDFFGLYYYDGNNWIKAISGQFSGGPSQLFTSLSVDSENRKWVTINLQGGGSKIAASLTDTSFVYYDSTNWGFQFTLFSYNGVVIDQNNIKYFGTTNGLLIYNDENWQFIDSSNSPVPSNWFKEGLSDSRNNKIYILSSFQPYQNYGLIFYNQDSVIVTSAEHNSLTINNFYLSQNYPNPFNPITKIKFSIPKSELVQIRVYDILGKEVKTLLNEYKQAGTYEIEFSTGSFGDASNLSSGVYFYRMISGSYSETKKMILLR
uniref:T9SS type A sorting domain-containing protein n=1 Tax=Ignavibacterium album TaxID=591197 RepID=A0A832G7R6_9BACT